MTPASSTRNDPLLRALRTRGSRIRQVRYRVNRTVLLSISRDGRTLNSHACFRDAPQPVVDAVAIYLTSRRGSTAGRRALEHLRSWEGTRRGLADARRQRPARRLVRHDGPETAPLRGLFDAFNRERFGGALPRIPLRVSHRMRRTLGSARYGGEGVVEEIAICADLLLPGNREVLEDTMLHEMAHAEAWIRHGHRGHGKVWKTIARRVGCSPASRCRGPIARRARA